jgi:hypothetical protein
MNERELIKKLHQENKKFRLKANAMKAERVAVMGEALFVEFSSEVRNHGVYLELAVLSCEITVGIAFAQLFVNKIIGDSSIQENADNLFKRAVRVQKNLMPYIDAHLKFSMDTEAWTNPETVQRFLGEMEKTMPLMQEANDLQDFCVKWRGEFAEKMRAHATEMIENTTRL